MKLMAPRSRFIKAVVDKAEITGHATGGYEFRDLRTNTERTADTLLNPRTAFNERREAVRQWRDTR